MKPPGVGELAAAFGDPYPVREDGDPRMRPRKARYLPGPRGRGPGAGARDDRPSPPPPPRPKGSAPF